MLEKKKIKMVKRTIPIPENLYNDLMELSDLNFRPFNNELYKALDFYIKSCKSQVANLDIQILQKVQECQIVSADIDEVHCEAEEEIEVEEF